MNGFESNLRSPANLSALGANLRGKARCNAQHSRGRSHGYAWLSATANNTYCTVLLTLSAASTGNAFLNPAFVVDVERLSAKSNPRFQAPGPACSNRAVIAPDSQLQYPPPLSLDTFSYCTFCHIGLLRGFRPPKQAPKI